MIEIVKRDRAAVREAFVEIAREEVGPRYAEAVVMLDAAMAATVIRSTPAAPQPDAPLRGTPDEACIGDPEHQYHSHDDEPDPGEDADPQPDPAGGPVVTFTPEAIAGIDPKILGELIQDRVRRGARTIRIEALEDVGRRLGWRVVEDEPRPEAPDAD